MAALWDMNAACATAIRVGVLAGGKGLSDASMSALEGLTLTCSPALVVGRSGKIPHMGVGAGPPARSRLAGGSGEPRQRVSDGEAPSSSLQRPCHGGRVALDQGQEHTGRLVRPCSQSRTVPSGRR